MTIVPLDDCDKLYHRQAVKCPKRTTYKLVDPAKCQKCDYGKAGSYKEGWVMCKYNTEHPVPAEEEDDRT